MEFREYIPAQLNPLVTSIFERKVTQPMKVRFLPDGTVSLIFYIGEKIASARGKHFDSSIFNPTEYFCFVTGLHTEPIYFDMDGLHSIGLRMRPAAIRAFWGIPVEEFRDRVTDWELAGEMNHIEDQIRGLATFQERALWLESYFYAKLKQTDVSSAVHLQRLIGRMETDLWHGERPQVEDYSGYSKMHTHRIFKEWTGLTPGKLLRYRQFIKAVHLLHHSTEPSLTQIGLSCGFYDQAHFIRVFREFAQMTPGQYRQLRTPIPGILPW